MIIRKFRTDDRTRIMTLYRICFSGPPWNQKVTDEEATVRCEDHFSRVSFTCFVAEEGQIVIGASWFDMVSHQVRAKGNF